LARDVKLWDVVVRYVNATEGGDAHDVVMAIVENTVPLGNYTLMGHRVI
tara:strand:+ start:7 stop:153 length:147 start_codon:yes stop_codon:yes gene_type:complete